MKAPKRARTAKEEKFCLEHLKSGNASYAYRMAYSCARMKPATINRKATALMKKDTIRARLAELRAPAVQKAKITFETHLARLDSLRRRAQKLGQMSAAISAEIARGKAAGLYVEKVEHTGAVPIVVNVTAVQVNAVVEALRGEF